MRALALWVFLGLLLTSVASRAEPSDKATESVPPGGSAAAAVQPSIPPSAAKIVLIGALADDQELVLLLDELLGRQGLAIELGRAERFDPDALFAEHDLGHLRVFVALRDSRQARLYFRGPRGDRYLLRKLSLPSGLDAVGRELIGQVVESSVAALSSSTEGISREQATEELAREAEPPRASPRPEPQPRVGETKPVAAGKALELYLAARYLAEWSGPDLGLSHGPGAAFGIRWLGQLSYGFELGAERFFTQTLEADALRAEVQKSAFHGLFELGLPFARRHRAAIALGPSLEISRLRPLSSVAGVTLAAPTNDFVPGLRLELRYTFGVKNFLFGAAAALDASFVRTHYDLEEAGTTTELAAPWLVRPGGALTIAVR